jgi:hypothetical protein
MKLNFDLLKSKTFWGALTVAISSLTQADWSQGVPIVAVITAVGGLIAVIGARDAIAGNGANSVKADLSNTTIGNG